MITQQYKNSIVSALEQINEAIRPQDFVKAGTLILNYFKKNGFGQAVKMPGVEEYKNANERGVGIRYFYGGIKSVRLNWVGTGPQSNIISSADIWFDDKNTSGGSDIHIQFGKSLSLVKALPALVNVMKKPVVGTEYIFEDFASNLTESILNVLNEASLNVNRDIVDKYIASLEDGTKVADMRKIFGEPIANKIVYQLRKQYPEMFQSSDARGGLVFRGSNKDINIDALMGGAGGVKVVVSKGPTAETILPSATDKKLDKDGDRLVFEEQLKDMRAVIKLLLSGAAYSMFLAGRGGVGKTHGVEEVLNAAGKTDGNGYFKITGTASPIGIYKALFKNKNGILLFDDCDGALGEVDARNLIKAATDTKKVRKLVWMKKTGKDFYNPDEEDGSEDDGEDSDGDDRTPSYFNFEGKVIFISNLSLQKLDPDGSLRTRSFVVNIDPTDMEVVEYMEKIAPSVPLEDGLSLSLGQRKEVVELLKTMVGKRDSISIRNLVRGLNIRASGIADWENIIRRYA